MFLCKYIHTRVKYCTFKVLVVDPRVEHRSVPKTIFFRISILNWA